MAHNQPAWSALRRVIGVTICTVATAPMVPILASIDEAIAAKSLRPLIANFDHSLDALLFGWMGVSLFMLLVAVSIAIAMHVLVRLIRDSFMVALGAGVVIGYAALCGTAVLVMGDAPGLNFDQAENGADAAISVTLTSSMSALYWLIVARRDRSARMLADLGASAIRAME